MSIKDCLTLAKQARNRARMFPSSSYNKGKWYKEARMWIDLARVIKGHDF